MNSGKTSGRTTREKAATVESLESRQLMSVVIGLQAKNTLIAFDSATPATVLATVKVKGLQRSESLLGIDFRPANNQLYGLGSSNRLYTIDPVSGDATAVGTSTLGVPLSGTEFGFDFNPAADRVRVVSGSGQNLRINPNDGAVVDSDANTPGLQADGNLAYGAGDVHITQAPSVIAVAYTNNDNNGATPTTLFGIDSDQNTLVRQGSPDGSPVSPNTGNLFTVGTLNVDVGAIGGFDVVTSGAANNALAALSTNPRRASQLYTIDLGTGAATAVGNIGRGRRQTLDIAAAPSGTAFFVVTKRNELLGLTTAAPNLVLSRTRITGLARREFVTGIDFRPATGELFAFTDQLRLYALTPGTGVAAAVGSPTTLFAPDRRESYGFDFNPAVDRVRVVSKAGNNFRLNPTDGAVVDFNAGVDGVQPDTGLAFVPGDSSAGDSPDVVAAAYANNVAGGTPTTLYVLDEDKNVLATQGSPDGTPTSPNTGQLFTVGGTGINVPDDVGFDIVTSAGTNTGLAVLAPGGRGATGLYSVNLATGAMTLMSTLSRKVKGVVAMAAVTGT